MLLHADHPAAGAHGAHGGAVTVHLTPAQALRLELLLLGAEGA